MAIHSVPPSTHQRHPPPTTLRPPIAYMCCGCQDCPARRNGYGRKVVTDYQLSIILGYVRNRRQPSQPALGEVGSGAPKRIEATQLQVHAGTTTARTNTTRFREHDHEREHDHGTSTLEPLSLRPGASEH